MSSSEEFNGMMEDLNKISDAELHQNLALDLEAFGGTLFQDLKKFKKMRKEMVDKREALNKSIDILDKRIEIVLSGIKTLQQPT